MIPNGAMLTTNRVGGGGNIQVAQPTQTDADNQSFTFSQTSVLMDSWRFTKDRINTRLGFYGIAGKTTSDGNLFASGTVTTLNNGDATDTKTPAEIFSMGLDSSGQFRQMPDVAEKCFVDFDLNVPLIPRYVDLWKVITYGSFNDATIQINGSNVEIPTFDFGFDTEIHALDVGHVVGAGFGGTNLYRLYFEGDGSGITVYPKYFRTMDVSGSNTTHRPGTMKLYDHDDAEITCSHGLLYGVRFTGTTGRVSDTLVDGNSATYIGVATNAGYGLGVMQSAEYGTPIKSYSITTRTDFAGGSTQTANGWTEQISFDGIWWFTVGTRSGLTWANGETKTFIIGE